LGRRAAGRGRGLPVHAPPGRGRRGRGALGAGRGGRRGRAPRAMTDTKPLVLVVEDEHQMRTLLRLALASHGFRVLEVETGREALQQAAAPVSSPFWVGGTGGGARAPAAPGGGPRRG